MRLRALPNISDLRWIIVDVLLANYFPCAGRFNVTDSGFLLEFLVEIAFFFSHLAIFGFRSCYCFFFILIPKPLFGELRVVDDQIMFIFFLVWSEKVGVT